MDLPDKTGVPAVPKKEIKPVIAQATQVKRPATRRFFDFLFAESPRALGARVGRDVVVPRLKAAGEEAINSFVAGMFWGEGSSRPMGQIVKGTVLRGGMTNYNGLSHMPSALNQARQANQTRIGGNYQDLVVPTQQDAERLLAGMYDLLNEYRVVAIADLYELANISPQPSDNAYGWTTLDGSRISKVRDGYLLELPRPALI